MLFDGGFQKGTAVFFAVIATLIPGAYECMKTNQTRLVSLKNKKTLTRYPFQYIFTPTYRKGALPRMKYGYIAMALLLSANMLKLVRAILLCRHREIREG